MQNGIIAVFFLSDVTCISDLHFDTDICLIFFLSQKSVFLPFCSVFNVLFTTVIFLCHICIRKGVCFSIICKWEELHVYMHAWASCCFRRPISTKTFWTALTASVDSCMEKKSAPSVV